METEQDAGVPAPVYVQEIVQDKPGKKYYLSRSKSLIGRNLNAEVPVNYANVSRNHAVIEYTNDSGWCIMDNKSINGVYVDHQKLKPCTFTPLQVGQKIFLGPPEMTTFYLKFHMQSEQGRENGYTEAEVDFASPSCSSKNIVSKSNVIEPRKRGAACSSTPVIDKKLHSPRKSDSGLLLKERVAAVDSLLKMNEAIDQRVRRILNRSEDTLNGSFDQTKACSESLLPEHFDVSVPWSDWSDEEITSRIPRDDNIYEKCTQETSRNNQEFSELQKKVALLEKELQEREKELKDREKAKLELQEQLQQKETLLKEEELKKKKALEKIEEQKLQSSLIEAQSLKQKVNSEVASQFGQLLESELTCSICTELFVKATTLDCSHTFCQDCLTKWKKTKKECPICRTFIQGMTHSLVIDGFIDKLVEKLGKEEQEKRKQVLIERSKPKEVKKPAKKRKGRATSRNTRNSRRNAHLVEVPLNSTFTQELLSGLFDLDNPDYMPIFSDFLDEDNLSQSEEPSYAYYGGYGRCYNCGGHGHWANGCPEA